MKYGCRFTLLLCSLLAAPALAAVSVTPRHLMILREGLGSLYGSYVFGVFNTGDKPEHFKTPVMLPKETDDFSAQEGVEAGDLTLAPGGGVTLEKEFPPGMQIVSIGFRTKSRYGRGVLTLTPTLAIDSFTLLIPRLSGLQVSAPKLAIGDASNAPDPQYEPYINASVLQSGETVTIAVDGLPEDRSQIWIVGAGVAAMLLLMAGFLAWRTRPQITSDGAATVLIG